jgi:hypothetical protein
MSLRVEARLTRRSQVCGDLSARLCQYDHRLLEVYEYPAGCSLATRPRG